MDIGYRLPPSRLGSARASTALTLGSASVLDTHRPYRPDHYNEGLLTEEVSRPFLGGEGINEGLIGEEAGAIGGTDPEDLEGALVLGELFEIALGEFGLDRLLMGGIDQSNAGALEACT